MPITRRGFLGRIAAVVALAPLVKISATPDAVEAAPEPVVDVPNPHQDNLAHITLLSQQYKDGLVSWEDFREIVYGNDPYMHQHTNTIHSYGNTLGHTHSAQWYNPGWSNQ